MMRKAILVVASLVALLLVVTWLPHGSSVVGPAIATGAGRDPAGPQELPRWELTTHHAAPVPIDVGPDGIATGDTAPPPTGPDLAPAAGTGLVPLSGTLRLANEDGVERPVTTASFDLIARLPGSRVGRSGRVRVVDGAWSTRVPADSLLDPGNFEVEGRFAQLVRVNGVELARSEQRLPVPDERRLDLVVRHMPASRLVVRSSTTGRDLSGLELLACTTWGHGEGPHASSNTKECRSFQGMSSPIDLGDLLLTRPPREAGTTLWVRAPDHAWGRIEVDLASGGERVLLLEPACELELIVQGVRAVDGAMARLRRLDDGDEIPVREVPLEADGSVLVESLLPGRYGLTAEVGDWFRTPAVLAEAEADLAAGRRTVVTLTLRSAGEIVTVPLGGSVRVPGAWGLARFVLEAELLDTPIGGHDRKLALDSSSMQPVEGAPGAWTFRFPSVQPGRWSLGLRRPAHAITLDVGPQGRDDVLLELPEPARVSLEVRDADTAKRVDVDGISWHSAYPPGINGGSESTVMRDPQTGRFEFLATQGEITVFIWQEGYQFVEENRVIAPGLNLLVIELHRSFEITLVLRDGGTKIPWDENWDQVTLTPLSGQGYLRSWGWNGTNLCMGVDTPGLWRLKVPVLPGYQPVPERTVDVSAETPVTVEIELVRSP